MSMIHTSDFRKGIKVEVDGEPYIMTECNFVKPGKGQALYKCKLKSLIKGSVLDRTFKSDDGLPAADVRESPMQYLYRNGDNFVFMDPETFDQPELTEQQLGDTVKWLKEGLVCNITFYNDRPIIVEAPNQLVLVVTYTEPGARGNTATNVAKPAIVETGAEIPVPIFINQGDKIKVDTRTGEYIERVRD
jgi:elongation factor P